MSTNNSLNGMSERDIVLKVYEQILPIIDELNENDSKLDLKINRIGIYGSRYMGAYRPDSDLDIYVSYTGNIKEYALFNILHEKAMVIAGMKVDINPIRPEESGTVSQFLKARYGPTYAMRNFNNKEKALNFNI